METTYKEDRFAFYNMIHKKLVVLYNFKHFSTIWKNARSDFEQKNSLLLDKNIYKNLMQKNLFIEWVVSEIELKNLSSTIYFNKQDLKPRGWTPKIIEHFNLKPEKIISLGRGRFAYYYNLDTLMLHEETEEFYLLVSKKRKKK